MSQSTAQLRRKIEGAGDLRSVVRTMKAVAASSIGQYEQSVLALTDYFRTVELGLKVCLGSTGAPPPPPPRPGGRPAPVGAVVFGSDQGLVGRFNDAVAEFAIPRLAGLSPEVEVWAVGERVYGRLEEAGLRMRGLLPVPGSVMAITPLVGRIVVESEAFLGGDETAGLHLFFNRHLSGATYEPASQRLLPLDREWLEGIVGLDWPSSNLPQVQGGEKTTLKALVREYLFVSLFRACAESLASENASRLAAMQRAEKNIEELLENLNREFHQLRQSGIDEELFDVVSGFEALSSEHND